MLEIAGSWLASKKLLTWRREGLKKWDKHNDIIYGRPLSLLGVVIYSSQEFHFPFCYMQTLPINHIKAAEPRSKSDAKGQLISECLFEKIVWSKIPTKNLIDSAHYTCWAESIKFFVGILVQTIFSKRHSEIN